MNAEGKVPCAAIIHDYGHQGVNNDFLIKTRDELAIRYNDSSPNESNHCAAAYALQMSDPAFNYAPEMCLEDRNVVRASIIELVLATDMKRHFGLISQFQVRVCIGCPLMPRALRTEALPWSW